jgi:hypothetical protein
MTNDPRPDDSRSAAAPDPVTGPEPTIEVSLKVMK